MAVLIAQKKSVAVTVLNVTQISHNQFICTSFLSIFITTGWKM